MLGILAPPKDYGLTLGDGIAHEIDTRGAHCHHLEAGLPITPDGGFLRVTSNAADDDIIDDALGDAPDLGGDTLIT